MQRMPATVEEQLILKSIKEECRWENLPKRLQATLASKEEWHRRAIDQCIKKRLQWSTCFARKVCKEAEYYEEMMRYLRKNLALFPYHLAEYICRVMRVSPFKYYCDMIFEVMKNEQPYDSIPNFTAADALRVTGIGRNEFIDVMNKCRSKKIMWKLNKSIAKELLPTQPADFSIEPWWGVCLVNFTLEEFKKLTEEEMAMIDKAYREEENSFILFDPDIVRGLYRRGLNYFDIPVYPDDRFKVSRLEGFVSNKEQSYEDPIEELLYAVFVVSNENATVAELAATLQADLSQLQAAASFACRLGWAVKVIDPASILQDSSITAAPNIILSDEEDGSCGRISSANMSSDGNSFQTDLPGVENYGTVSGHARVAFIVDANITSYLMMGSVSPGLKSHAVTLYEAGKLGDSSIAELCKDLTTLEGTKFEGELQEFANHAFSLRCVLQCLQSGGVITGSAVEEIGFKLGMESLSYDEVISFIADTDIAEDSSNSPVSETGPDGDEHFQGLGHSNMPAADAIVESVNGGMSDESDLAVLSENKSDWNEDCEPEPKFQGDVNSVLGGCLESGKEIPKRKRKYRVDLLRCESLAALAPATLDRLFLRNYDIVVSMVPLPSSSVLPRPTGPIHFGPPTYSSLTPWMKLTLYSIVGSGPVSVVLMKGLCLRLLPAPLSGCEKALIWSWDGSTVGGLGGKFEGNLVRGNTLLHCLNSLLKYSAVLVQPLSKYDLNESGKIITMDIPLPLKNADGSSAHLANEMGLSVEESESLNIVVADLSNKMDLWTIGYIRLIRLYKARESYVFSLNDKKYEWVPLSVEFGIPLFSPKLCSTICKRVVLSQLLQMDSLSEHHGAMQILRGRLHDVCVEYQATSSTAKLLYERTKSRKSSQKLVTYASGRWNPLVDPSSPISGASSECQRLKFANRQRCRTEVMSFDGNILRSYALTPVYEAVTTAIEDSMPLNTINIEQEDVDSRQVALPGVNILFDGSELLPFDIGACLQARQPVSLIAEASAASASM